MELIVVISIMVILMTIGGLEYKKYEIRHRCHTAAQVLVMDLKLQQQRSRTLDTRRGILFENGSTYRLGYMDTSSVFHPDTPPRMVNFNRDFSGIHISSISECASFPTAPAYIYFSPRAEVGGYWSPFSTSFNAYPGVITVDALVIKAIIRIQQNGEITTEYQ